MLLNLTSSASKLTAWFALNWQLLLLKAALVVIILVSAFAYGVHTERERVLASEATRTAVLLQDAANRIPELADRDKAVLNATAALNSLKDQYEKAVDEVGDKPDCSLSPDELRILQELAQR